MPTPLSYTRSQIALHWLTALLVGFEILFSGLAERRWAARMAGLIPNEPMPNPHAVIGILVLALACCRLALRLVRGVPAPPAGEGPLVAFAARLTCALFYTLLFALPLSGFAAWWLGLPGPAVAHGLAANLLIALIALHVAAVFVHRFWFKTDVLGRMRFGGS